MASTGEIASFGSTIQEAYWAALLSQTGFKIPRPNSGVLLGGDVTKPEMTTVAEGLTKLGFKLYCSSSNLEEFLNSIPYVSAKRIFFPTKDKRKLREVFDEYDIECVINLAKGRGTSATDEDYVARRYVCSLALRVLGPMAVTGTLWTLDCPCSTTLAVHNCSLRHWPLKSPRAVSRSMWRERYQAK